MRDGIEGIAAFPPLRWLRRRLYERRVWTGSNWMFHGVYDSYAEAERHARAHPHKSVGYDTPGLAAKGKAAYEQMYDFDYPALFWISLLLGEKRPEGERLRVVDLGGALGEKYRLFADRDPKLAFVDWVVCDTSSAVEVARARPEAEKPANLSVTADRGVIDGTFLLFASGSLQYLDIELAAILDEVEALPRHLVINKLPLSSGADLWTLQNAGAIVPYHVMGRERWLGSLAERGYRVVDEWSIDSRSVRIPFHPELGTRANVGLCLTRG